MFLTQEDRSVINGSIQLMKQCFDGVRSLDSKEAVKDISEFSPDIGRHYRRKDGKDTKYFDIFAENIMAYGKSEATGYIALFQKIFGKHGVIITEERGRVPEDSQIRHDSPVVITDPVDASAFIEQMLNKPENKGKKRTLGEIFDYEVDRMSESERMRRAPNSSITYLRDNTIKCTIVLNFFTGDIYIGSPDGVYRKDIRQVDSLDDIDQEFVFKKDENFEMICYIKGDKYEDNVVGTHLRFFRQADFCRKGPVGPLRFTYLIKMDNDLDNVGIVAHNGEKIQEILPNIAIALFSKGRLRAYKLFCDDAYIQERSGRGLTPNLSNSLFGSGLIRKTGVQLSFLNNYDYPSQFRDTTVITSEGNDVANTMLEGMVGREYAIRIV